MKSALALAALGALISECSAKHGLADGLQTPVHHLKKRQSSDSTFNWTLIQPSENLTWTPCYGSFECARLAVPLDYEDPSGDQAAIALLKSPSKIPPGQDGYLGPILFNPGGPGGSGVETVLTLEELFRATLGDNYDLVGFDPRGVGFTTPGIFAFKSTPEGSTFSDVLNESMNETFVSLGTMYAKSQTLGALAKTRIQSTAERVSTPIVATDMLSIVKAFGMDKLQYWGFSYGTVLGATFATMFPDNVGRIVIDGVVDAVSWYAGQYNNDLADTDKALDVIYQACVDAGPSACPIHETTVDAINTRVNNLLDRLKADPLSFFNETTGEYGTLDYGAAKAAILSALYVPYDSGAALTRALALAEQGQAQTLFALSNGVSPSSNFQCDCDAGAPTPFATGLDVVASIACGDQGVQNTTIQDLRDLYGGIQSDSQFGDLWTVFITCSGWQVAPKVPFTGSFNNVNTSFPVLLIGNTADPATPIHNAFSMSQRLVNSVVLTQNGAGHASVAANSSCTTDVVKGYFQNGTLPANGTVCNVDSTIFG